MGTLPLDETPANKVKHKVGNPCRPTQTDKTRKPEVLIP